MWKCIAICSLTLASPSAYADEDTPWSESAKVLACPASVPAGEFVLVTLAPGRGSELALRRVADDAWFFLVVGMPPDDYPQLMTPEQFESAVYVKLPPSLSWVQWTQGTKMERVFTPGLYELYVSDALESENGGFRCRFTYGG
jgi:hypothetical protein